jgi:hypothetical protein
MKKILLTRGKFTIINNRHFIWLSKWKWCARPDRNGKYFYAVRNIVRPKRKMIYMHKLILSSPAKKRVDHKNGDTLDNRRRNLRVCSIAQNGWNSKKRIDNTSGVKGVSWSETNQAWQAVIQAKLYRIHLGFFPTIKAAYIVRKRAALKLHKEFVRI